MTSTAAARTVARALIAALLLAGPLACGSADEPMSPAAQPEMAADACRPAEHPGTIAFVNADTNTTKVEPLEKVPPSLHFRKDADGRRVPVVKVVFKTMAPGHAEITLYGPCDRWLESTIGFTKG